MREDDLEAAATVAAAAFDVDIGDEGDWQSWLARVAYPLGTDPDGAFVAERHGRVIAVAQALRRERIWCLSLLAVDPDVQSAGAGRLLMERSMTYGGEVVDGLIVSSADARALRLYGTSGFALRPTFDAEGKLDRSALPRPDRAIKEVREDELERLAPISRAVRGAAHTSELRFAMSRGARVEALGDRGFVVEQSGRVWLLVARDEEAATALLWTGLEYAAGSGIPSVRWITGEQQWALSVLLRANLRLTSHGALGVRGDPGPLAPFLPSPPFA